MKKAVLYGRTSTPDQHLESQLVPLRDIVAQRGLELTGVYSDFGISSSKARRPGIDSLLRDARRGKVDVILIAALDRLGRNVRNCLELVAELDSLGIELISAREAVDTSTPTGRMFVTLLGSITALEKSFIRERIRAGMRRRRIDGLPIGRQPLNIDHAGVVADRLSGMSLTDAARKYSISRASVVRWVRESRQTTSMPLAGVSASRVLVEECAA